MKTHFKIGVISLGMTVLMAAPLVHAATPPPLGMADSFSILSGTYTNTTPGTTINGDLGYTTPPATPPTVNGTTHVADATYNQAGIDQGTALSALNSQPCTSTFPAGAIDLASDTTHGTVGVYAPGVYCITGDASIGGGGTITLTGSGTYIFRMTGALNTSVNSVLAMAGGASACNVWWTPGAATTLGANSTFGGTDIDAAGVSVGNLVIWTGRALAFGGTITTSTDTISSSACTASSSNGSGAGASSGKATNPTQGVSGVSKTPGLPNTGQSPPRQSSLVRDIELLGIFGVSMMLVRVVRKRV
jgi:hypothetical protein